MRPKLLLVAGLHLLLLRHSRFGLMAVSPNQLLLGYALLRLVPTLHLSLLGNSLLRLVMVGMHLALLSYALLGLVVGAHLALLGHTLLRLMPTCTGLTLLGHSGLLAMLWPLQRRALLARPRCKAAAPSLRHGVTATVELRHWAVAAATTANLNRRRVATATTVLLGLGLTAPAVATAMRTRTRRGCDRQRGNARCEKHPGHYTISSRTVKTARSLHRSNA